MATDTQPFADIQVFVTVTPKGGAGKTETADILEAILTLSDRSPLLVDVDDGNSGLARRIGRDHVVKLNWSSTARHAPIWVAEHVRDVRAIIFDIGAGLDSSDLPILSMLQSIWRLLADGGAQILFCAVVSTNAPVSSFVQRLHRTYMHLGTIAIVYNDQDGSGQWPEGIGTGQELPIHLPRAGGGLQALRLSRREPLSQILLHPQEGYHLATAMMAARVLLFADSPGLTSIAPAATLERLSNLASGVPRRLHYRLTTLADTQDQRVLQNERMARTHDALLRSDLSDEAVVTAAGAYRQEFRAWWRTRPTAD